MYAKTADKFIAEKSGMKKIELVKISPSKLKFFQRTSRILLQLGR